MRYLHNTHSLQRQCWRHSPANIADEISEAATQNVLELLMT